MKKNPVIFFSLIAILAFFCVLFGKIKFLGRPFLEKKQELNIDYGDMYTLAEIDFFKGRIPIVPSVENTPLQDAKIFTIGDSFFQTSHESENFANELEKLVQKPVYNVIQQSDDFIQVANPLRFLSEKPLKNTENKILILQSTDWRSIPRALNYSLPPKKQKTTVEKIISLIFENGDVEYFTRHNSLVSPLRRKIKNLKFNSLGEIDSKIGAFDLQSKMLFYFEEVNFNERAKTKAEIMSAANGIAQLSNILKQQYNIDLIYINMPDKYAVYGKRANANFTYDNFSGRLKDELDKKNINSIDVYKIFNSYITSHPNELLYYPSDSHYTALGKRLVVEAAAKTILNLKVD